MESKAYFENYLEFAIYLFPDMLKKDGLNCTSQVAFSTTIVFNSIEFFALSIKINEVAFSRKMLKKISLESSTKITRDKCL